MVLDAVKQLQLLTSLVCKYVVKTHTSSKPRNEEEQRTINARIALLWYDLLNRCFIVQFGEKN